MDIHVIWFVLLGVLLAGYAILDGFDLGVGILHPLAPEDQDRRLFLNSIGPIWDGNEVWLVVFGGALLAAFPEAYATVFSGYYLALMLVLWALIFRAVSIEFRSKQKSPGWRRFWDFSFFGSSTVASLVFGIAVGNSMVGIPLDARGNYLGSFLDLLRPYPILAGLVVVAMNAMHGAMYLFLKLPEGHTRNIVRGWMWHTWGWFLVLYMLGTMYTVVAIKRSVANFEQFPWAVAIVVLNVLAIANIPRSVYANKPIMAFASSTVNIMCLVALFGVAHWPNMVYASNDPTRSLTIYNAASSEGTLWIMLVIAMIGLPFVLTYTATVYWTFRGRVELGEHSY
ncbi:MAG TPA: cytochrome d ubiquinol oxidase subunit II [Bryobacteraceae bacterium]|nr:cytochrome d ubiquinol oxidase subunit II [Bryobacteraceae bacterium]